MSKLEFTMNLSSSPQKLLEMSKDYESFSNYLPQQLKKVKIIKNDDSGTITEEILVFSTLFKNEVTQQSIHTQKSNNTLSTEIISGPAKSSIIDVHFDAIDSGTIVTVNVELKISLKYKILQPIIKKWYKLILSGILLKMNQKILNESHS